MYKRDLFYNCETLCLFISVINQLDAQNFCFTISLFHASTCFDLAYYMDKVLKFAEQITDLCRS
jgi:hypothetical protein